MYPIYMMSVAAVDPVTFLKIVQMSTLPLQEVLGCPHAPSGSKYPHPFTITKAPRRGGKQAAAPTIIGFLNFCQIFTTT